MLLALGQLESTGASAVSWEVAQDRLADLISEFGPKTRTARSQSAAYPFTRLRRDGIWPLDADVPDDLVGSLNTERPTGRLEADLERQLTSPLLRYAAARAIVEAHVPDTVAPDVLLARPDLVLHSGPLATGKVAQRQRSRRWVAEVLKAWDECCAFCGYDGRLGSTPVGIEAAHVRWFKLGGPDDLDNGFALCSLHHKLFDRGALGLPRHDSAGVAHVHRAHRGEQTGLRPARPPAPAAARHRPTGGAAPCLARGAGLQVSGVRPRGRRTGGCAGGGGATM